MKLYRGVRLTHWWLSPLLVQMPICVLRHPWFRRGAPDFIEVEFSGSRTSPDPTTSYLMLSAVTMLASEICQNLEPQQRWMMQFFLWFSRCFSSLFRPDSSCTG